ncbi:transposase family protein [Clostridium sp. ZS2-4]|uniref:transposase family protein n=1 Tax=Clostridium sp. ZS2-4 TaxID=2987703 RepID=UPI00227D2667|nr:transposase family protein [Clostridium sp. ZS2-4]MCY6355290.1 transposase family protein [Clostridium sp. ZS2-4]
MKCPKCDSIVDRLHDKKEFLVKDIPIHGKPVILIVEKIRLRCTCCGHRGIPIRIPFLNKYQRKTDRFIEFIAKEVAKTSINEVCQQLELGYQEIKSAFHIYSDKLINEIDKKVQDNGIEYFGIDEFALKKGHNYAVALINFMLLNIWEMH